MKTFKEFINEASDIDNHLMNFVDKVEWSIYERPTSISLNKVIIPKKERGSSAGTNFMKQLTVYADSKKKRIDLDPSTDFGASSKGRLIKFYKKFGFVENKGKNKDFEVSTAMYRDPQ